MVERVWNNPWPAIHVQYRNMTQIHFRAVPYEWSQLLEQGNYYPGRMDQDLRNELLAKRPALTWSQDLPATEDYLAAAAVFPVPDSLKPGFYFLIASPDPQFGERDNRVLVQEFWVSPLALVVRTGGGPDVIDGFVLEADTGEPIGGAQVRLWTRKRTGRQYQWTEGRSAKTNADGVFRIQGTANETYLLLARHQQYALATANQLRGYGRAAAKPFEQTVFFTDRSLYRPGQTIRFKGICVAVDQSRDKYQTLAGKTVTVIFEDANRQEIAKQVCRTNAFGSFSGSFTAPRDRLMGGCSCGTPRCATIRHNSMWKNTSGRSSRWNWRRRWRLRDWAAKSACRELPGRTPARRLATPK